MNKITSDKPFIKLFKSPRCYYVYSVNRDSIMPISKNIYEYLDGKLTMSSLSDDDIKLIQSLESNGFLSKKRFSRICHADTDNLENLLENNIHHMVLQVTQSCNLTCSYCPYANNTNGELQRNHANKHMNFDIAKKAIDYLIDHSSNENELTISFYGGEPLIKFDLIKSIVSYVKKVAIGKRIEFNMTTNGTLMNDEIIDYLVDNSFEVFFSIDGPSKIHDVNRKNRDGSGSFNVAFSNLKKMIEKYGDEDLHHVSINMVFDPNNNFDDVLELFGDPIFSRNINVLASMADDLQLEKSIVATSDYLQKINYLYFLGALDFLKIVKGLSIPSFVRSAFAYSEKTCTLMRDTTKELPEYGAPGGPCVPGVRRIFVTADGTFYPCEKVNEMSVAMKIGDIETGINIEKAKSILNIAQLTPEKCRNCWALLRCQTCGRMADDGKELSSTLKNKYCYKTFSYMDDLLKDFALINECKTVYKRGDIL